ncbi:CDC42 small effector protein homolog [Hetaerina americana]|uniref:CDC42 small effector protein homolog n=1 Tax=Hetaerina americana TaxID=62018 RepID=UPI003A7F4359
MATYGGGRSGATAGLGAVGEMWLQWFSCCVDQSASQQHHWRSNGSTGGARGRHGRIVGNGVSRLDRSMIGSPTNFQHTGHIGSGDVQLGASHLRAIQTQMQSKGGYETAYCTPIGGMRAISPSATAVPIAVAAANHGVQHVQAC